MIPQENISGLEAELNRDIQNLYVELFKVGKTTRITKLNHITKTLPDIHFHGMNEAVQKGYQKIFENGWTMNAEELRMLPYIEPDYNCVDIKDAVQKGYINLFLKGRTSGAEILNDFSGINPDSNFPGMNDAVQTLYTIFFKASCVYSLKDLHNLANLDNIYMNKLDSKHNDILHNLIMGQINFVWNTKILSVEDLKNFTGVPPSSELLKKYPQYAKFFGDLQ